MNDDGALAFDVRRTVLLASYIQAWGMPHSRTISEKGNHRVEVYFFPSKDDDVINRYATIGLSGHVSDTGKVLDWELFMAVPSDNAGATIDEIIFFILDVMAFSQRKDVPFKIGMAFAESPLMPQQWRSRAFLIDEPRAEPESLSEIKLGSEVVKLFWIIPIYKNEYEAIRDGGIEKFDKGEAASSWSPADPSRPSFLND
ncbi:suppressor of fused domain protein [Undibacterium flavidum]|uniref:Suppressor of fused domain protein n=1 Tax=Undibacterium flavidum TaxID=2762297 RepID=A0ABR6YHW8_9BURK|nr:suppressor of fused domain protein [Undibacterium flavidum]MBC3876122.1 suppressor of fused domain protein [Undibacterium flavidum]